MESRGSPGGTRSSQHRVQDSASRAPNHSRSEGVHVVLNGRDPQRLHTAAAQLQAKFPVTVLTVQGDIARPSTRGALLGGLRGARHRRHQQRWSAAGPIPAVGPGRMDRGGGRKHACAVTADPGCARRHGRTALRPDRQYHFCHGHGPFAPMGLSSAARAGLTSAVKAVTSGRTCECHDQQPAARTDRHGSSAPNGRPRSRGERRHDRGGVRRDRRARSPPVVLVGPKRSVTPAPSSAALRPGTSRVRTCTSTAAPTKGCSKWTGPMSTSWLSVQGLLGSRPDCCSNVSDAPCSSWRFT